MSVAIADGILGLEATCTYTPPDEFAAPFILNPASGLPRAQLRRIVGLHDLPDADDNREPATAYPGEVPVLGHARGRTIVYEGVIKARTMNELRAVSNAMRVAFRNRSDEGTFTHAPHATWGAVSHWFKARVIALSIPEDQDSIPASAMPSPYKRPFTLTVRQSDPRYYVTGLNSSPLQASAASYEATNLGGIETPPTFRIPGPLVDATVLLARQGGMNLRFDDITLAGGQTMVIDFRTRHAYNDANEIDLTGRINLEFSNWWDEGVPGLRAGITEEVGVTGATWYIDWYHANP